MEIGDEVTFERQRSRWAILWDRIRHPFTPPARTEIVTQVVIGTALGTPINWGTDVQIDPNPVGRLTWATQATTKGETLPTARKGSRDAQSISKD